MNVLETMPKQLFVRAQAHDCEEDVDSVHLGLGTIYIGFEEPGTVMECYRDGVTVRLGVYQLVGFVDATKNTQVGDIEKVAVVLDSDGQIPN